MVPLPFVPYHELGDQPNVIVDGSPTASTRLTLSHWPGSPTPTDLLDDLSAQIAFRALEQPGLFDGIVAVSNNHFDQDGLAGVYALVDPAEATRRRSQLEDLAAAGDFATFRERDSMRVAIALSAYADPDLSPLGAEVLSGGYQEQCGRLYESLLPMVPELLDHPERSRALWETEDAQLEEGLAAVELGVVRIEEVPALDLAVVTIPDEWAELVATRFTLRQQQALHPAAVHQHTERCRVLLLQGRRYRLQFRYESWVMFRSRPVLPRPDARVLAEQLNGREAAGARWIAPEPGALTPELQLVSGESAIPPEAFRRTVEAFLATAPAVWDPYAR